MLYKGKDLAISVNFDNKNEELLALSKSCTLEITADIIEGASITNGRSKRFIPGKHSWKVSSESLIAFEAAQLKKLISCMEEGKEVLVFFGASGFIRYGNALVQSISVSGTLGSMATYNITLQGTGPLAFL